VLLQGFVALGFRPQGFVESDLEAINIVAGILIFTGSFLLNERGFQFVKLAGFISNIRGPAVDTVHPDPKTQQQVRLRQPDITNQADIVQNNDTQQAPEKDVEPDTRVKNDEVSYQTARHHLLNPKSPGPTLQDKEADSMRPEAALNKNDRSEIQEDDKEKSNIAVPVKEEDIIRQIVVKKGDTLSEIIIQTYGAYDDLIMNKVQRLNPKINDPDSILAGQVIRMPINRGQRKVQ